MPRGIFGGPLGLMFAKVSLCPRQYSSSSPGLVRLTDDIVAERIPDQCGKHGVPLGVPGYEQMHDGPTLFLRPIGEALFNHIACELLARKRNEIRFDDDKYSVPILCVTLLDDVLDDIVSILIGHEGGRMRVKFLQNIRFGRLFAELQQPLNHAAPIWMHRELWYLTSEGIDDETDVLEWDQFDNLLDDVVAMLIPDTSQHMAF